MKSIVSVIAFLLLIQLATFGFAAETAFEVREITYSGGPYKEEAFQYRLLRPETIEPGRKYPVVLFLHGAGERGTDNKRQLFYFPQMMESAEFRKKYPCYVIAPQCRSEKQWVNVPWGDQKSTPMAKEPSHQLQMALKTLQKTLSEEQIDHDRVYLTGLSMGGYGSWELAARHSDLFAAVVAICGGGDEAQAWKFVALPTWATHGDADGAVPVGRSRSMIESIKNLGGNPHYVEYKKAGHNVWSRTYTDPKGAVPWMFQQVRNLDERLGFDSFRHSGVPEGTVTQHSWKSDVFKGTTRDFWVYVPEQYDDSKPANVMVFQDGHAYIGETGQFRVPVVFDNLIHKKEMPVTIGIFLNPGHTGENQPKSPWRVSNRSFEYDTLSDQYARFLVEEILPEVGKSII